MTRFIFTVSFLLGAFSITWMALQFWNEHTLGLLVVAVIAFVYALGTWELVRYRAASATLSDSLNTTSASVEDLEAWLASIHASIRHQVRLRITGLSTGLPLPILSPYLVGLLVMLGLLGTFFGMVDTLKGAVVALEGSNELEAIRRGLTAPIGGLGLAFGTSVAGVAASAMLGLLSAISKRERIKIGRKLDAHIATHFSQFSAIHQQKSAFDAIVKQTEYLPKVVDRLGELADSLSSMSNDLSHSLTANQAELNKSLREQSGDLNDYIKQGLNKVAEQSSVQLSETLMPVATQVLESVSSTSAAQLSKLEEAFKGHQSGLESLTQDQSVKIAQSVDKLAESITTAFTAELQSLREAEEARGQQALLSLDSLRETLADRFADLGENLERPMSSLLQSVTETPESVNELLKEVRGAVLKSHERETTLIQEREQLLSRLDELSGSITEMTSSQSQAVVKLVETSSDQIKKMDAQLVEQVQAEQERLKSMIELSNSGSQEMALLSTSLVQAVQSLIESNTSFIETMVGLQTSLEKADQRGNEQLQYYVEQAREIIDHNLSTHQQILDSYRDQAALIGSAGASS